MRRRLSELALVLIAIAVWAAWQGGARPDGPTVPATPIPVNTPITLDAVPPIDDLRLAGLRVGDGEARVLELLGQPMERQPCEAPRMSVWVYSGLQVVFHRKVVIGIGVTGRYPFRTAQGEALPGFGDTEAAFVNRFGPTATNESGILVYSIPNGGQMTAHIAHGVVSQLFVTGALRASDQQSCF